MKIDQQANQRQITRGDIRNMLTAYSGAIALDQLKVDALPSTSFHPFYSRGMWLRWRRSHIAFIDQLHGSTRDIPSELLQKINVMAAAQNPKRVRRAIVNFLSIAVSESWSAGQIDSAPLFFAALVEDVGTGAVGREKYNFGRDVYKNRRKRFERWLRLVDPLSIADDPECQYHQGLQIQTV
jgi:hypothetical protein